MALHTLSPFAIVTKRAKRFGTWKWICVWCRCIYVICVYIPFMNNNTCNSLKKWAWNVNKNQIFLHSLKIKQTNQMILWTKSFTTYASVVCDAYYEWCGLLCIMDTSMVWLLRALSMQKTEGGDIANGRQSAKWGCTIDVFKIHINRLLLLKGVKKGAAPKIWCPEWSRVFPQSVRFHTSFSFLFVLSDLST